MPPTETPFWRTTATFPPANPDATPLPQNSDVAIIGGGYTGLAAARELALRGARVAVLEQHTFGWGASSRNGGMVLTGTKLSASKLLKLYNKPVAQDLWRNSLEAIAYVERLVHTENIECDFRRCGHLELACKPSHYQAFAHEAELLNRDFNHAVKQVAQKDLPAEIGSTLHFGGLVDEASAGINPAQYAAGLTRAAQRAGALLFDGVQVKSISRNGRAFAIDTSKGNVYAQQILVATNGYTGAATPTLQRKIIPVGSYIIATEPLGEKLAHELVPKNRMVYDSKNFLYYWRLSQDHRLVFGGRAAFAPETPSTVRESALILQRGMAEIYPQLKNTRIDYAWGGTLGFTFDLLPHAGTSEDGLTYALGCGGHGVAMLSHLGACAAQKMLGENTDNPIFNLPTPAAPLGLYTGNAWFLPFAGLYYRLLDRVS